MVPHLDTVVGAYGVDDIGPGGDEKAQDRGRDRVGGALGQFDESQLGCVLDSLEQVELAWSGLLFSDVDVKIADWVTVGLLVDRPFGLDLRQPADAMPGASCPGSAAAGQSGSHRAEPACAYGRRQ